MKNIFRLFILTFVVACAAIACTDDADRDWTTQDAAFNLHNTTLGANVLYETMQNNPFILTWDKADGIAAPYSVVVSSTADFAKKVELGTSTELNFRTTVGSLNTAMLQAGVNPYKAQKVYLRIESGSAFSNTISFDVTPYPTAVPVLTNPTSASKLVLEKEKAAELLTKVTWTDYATYGVDVLYTIEMATKGSTEYQAIGTATNVKEFDWTHMLVNDAIIKLGALPGVEAEFDVRVSATTSTTGTIVKTSAPVTIKLTAYESNTPLYLIGDATAGGWTNEAGNVDMYPLLSNKMSPTKYTYTGFFNAGGFKFVQEKGSWTVGQYGKGSEDGKLDSSGGSGNISIDEAGYYTVTIDTSKLTYTIEKIARPTVTYPTVGIIGSATPKGWDASTPMNNSTFDANVWTLDVTLTSGEIKFRANDAWDVDWGSNDTNFGTATLKGSNMKVEAGDYTIYFNDFSGAFTLVKK